MARDSTSLTRAVTVGITFTALAAAGWWTPSPNLTGKKISILVRLAAQSSFALHASRVSTPSATRTACCSTATSALRLTQSITADPIGQLCAPSGHQTFITNRDAQEGAFSYLYI